MKTPKLISNLFRTAWIGLAILLLSCGDEAFAQGMAFTYQGRLTMGGAAASGNWDLQFKLYDSSTSTNQIGGTLTNKPVPVNGGLFSVTLDFGSSAFDGNSRWLEISARTNGSVSAYALMSPRVALLPAPYAVYAARSAGSGVANIITGANATVAGGLRNTNYCDFGTIGGGYQNIIQSSADNSTIGGGTENSIQTGSYRATIAGGLVNTIQANAQESFIGGGSLNLIQSETQYGVIAGGEQNLLMYNADDSVIAGGGQNTISTNAQYAMIPGGRSCSIGEDAAYAFAAGRKAKANHQGAFVWADSANTDFISEGANSFSVRASGGAFFESGNAGGNQNVIWTPGSGSWSFSSDRNQKDRFTDVDVRMVLGKVSRLPISEWSYKGYEQRHIGPMAQDFHAAFPFNKDDKSINELDLHGVELAAIKGLNQKLDEKLKEKDSEIQSLKERLEAVEKLLQKSSRDQSASLK